MPKRINRPGGFVVVVIKKWGDKEPKTRPSKCQPLLGQLKEDQRCEPVKRGSDELTQLLSILEESGTRYRVQKAGNHRHH